MRGEYTHTLFFWHISPGSSPPARGIHCLFKCIRQLTRIIPACAGNTMLQAASQKSAEDHPRLRGEYGTVIRQALRKLGSSPPARGIQVRADQSIYILRIIPACAGNTRPKFMSEATYRDHPRLRGEYTKKSLIFFSLPFLL